MPTYSDRELMKIQEAGALGTTGAVDPIGTTKAAHSDTFQYVKSADDAMASTTTAETYTGVYFPRACRVKSIIYLATTGGITADNTNFATITVSQRDAAAANPLAVGVLATTITASGGVTQGVGKAMPLTTANVLVPAGGSLTFTIAKSGSGVIVRAGTFNVDVEWV